MFRYAYCTCAGSHEGTRWERPGETDASKRSITAIRAERTLWNIEFSSRRSQCSRTTYDGQLIDAAIQHTARYVITIVDTSDGEFEVELERNVSTISTYCQNSLEI